MIYNQPGGAFFPVLTSEANKIKIYPVKHPIFLKGEMTYSPNNLLHYYYEWR
ncbi:hypothetical protein [Candidatus Arsenophonus triatominarum]|uniref:hypothetical protein n=1 Tax=Candidatus Arsenophonus triatominarum TaxID=57911 RepID=UPI00164F47ED|nr:hypothetical protein [Candidatus Arsenophonus triatominarum]